MVDQIEAVTTVMKYQDLKIRDFKRLLIIGLIVAVLLAGLLFFRTQGEAVADHLFRPGKYMAIVTGLGWIGPVALAMCVYYLLTSPRQNAAHIAWMVRHLGAKPPTESALALLDAKDSAYGLTTLQYWLQRRS